MVGRESGTNTVYTRTLANMKVKKKNPANAVSKNCPFSEEATSLQSSYRFFPSKLWILMNS